jgi:hypothetical protein
LSFKEVTDQKSEKIFHHINGCFKQLPGEDKNDQRRERMNTYMNAHLNDKPGTPKQ